MAAGIAEDSEVRLQAIQAVDPHEQPHFGSSLKNVQ